MISAVNLLYINEHPTIEEVQYDIVPYHEVGKVELDEMWSYVYSKENPRWLWFALDHQNRQILAYTFGRRKDAVLW